MREEKAPPGGVVWITGASSGLGRALALRFAEEGAEVVASARGEEALRSLCEEAESFSGSIAALPLDVTDGTAFATCTEHVEREFGAIGTLVLNAGTHIPVDARDFRAAPFQQLLDVNVMGVVNGLAAVLPYLRSRRRGRIAVVASLSGYRGLPTAPRPTA